MIFLDKETIRTIQIKLDRIEKEIYNEEKKEQSTGSYLSIPWFVMPKFFRNRTLIERVDEQEKIIALLLKHLNLKYEYTEKKESELVIKKHKK